MSRDDLRALSALSQRLQEQLPGDFRVFKAVAHDPDPSGKSEPECEIDYELMVVSDHHAVFLQGRPAWIIRMAQKYEFGEFNHG